MYDKNTSDINTLIKIEKVVERWNNEEISADECLYQIQKLIETNDDAFWEERSKDNIFIKPKKEIIEFPVKYIGKIKPGPERK
jgi:hypothetical protein